MKTVKLKYTNGMQQFIVPTNVDTATKMRVALTGAAGGGGQGTGGTGGAGGKGGYIEGDLAVTPGETLYVYVGGQGDVQQLPLGHGFNGGGAQQSYAGGGGGATDIRVGNTTLASRVAVAGGGGGGFGGGNGGGSTGQAGLTPGNGAEGSGGTQSAGGIGGSSVLQQAPGSAGSLGQGGGGGHGGNYDGGAGGGGYYGGGGGAAYTPSGTPPNGSTAGGGGGSSYTGGLTGVIVNTQGGAVGFDNGLASLTFNLVPNAPIPLLPNNHNIDRGIANVFPWQFNDDDTTDSQSAYEFQWRVGTGAFTTTGKVTSTTQAATVAANTFTSGTVVEWQARTWDQSGAVSAFSASQYVNVYDAPATSFAFLPFPAAPMTTAVPEIQGHRTDNAAITSWRMQIVNDVAGVAGSTVLADTGVVTPSATVTAVDQIMPLPATPYVNGQSYHVLVKIAQPADVWQHAWTDSGAILANIHGPGGPTFTLTTDPVSATNTIVVTNPTPDTYPPDHNLIYRYDPRDGSTVAIGSVGLNGTFVDRAAPLNRPVSYYVAAVTFDGAVTLSA